MEAAAAAAGQLGKGMSSDLDGTARSSRSSPDKTTRSSNGSETTTIRELGASISMLARYSDEGEEEEDLKAGKAGAGGQLVLGDRMDDTALFVGHSGGRLGRQGVEFAGDDADLKAGSKQRVHIRVEGRGGAALWRRLRGWCHWLTEHPHFHVSACGGSQCCDVAPGDVMLPPLLPWCDAALVLFWSCSTAPCPTRCNFACPTLLQLLADLQLCPCLVSSSLAFHSLSFIIIALITHPRPQTFTTVVIVANAIVMAFTWYPNDPTRDQATSILNYVFTIYFVFEMAVKLAGMGAQQYMADGMNNFDALVTVRLGVQLQHKGCDDAAMALASAMLGWCLHARRDRSARSSIVQSVCAPQSICCINLRPPSTCPSPPVSNPSSSTSVFSCDGPAPFFLLPWLCTVCVAGGNGTRPVSR